MGLTGWNDGWPRFCVQVHPEPGKQQMGADDGRKNERDDIRPPAIQPPEYCIELENWVVRKYSRRQSMSRAAAAVNRARSGPLRASEAAKAGTCGQSFWDCVVGEGPCSPSLSRRAEMEFPKLDFSSHCSGYAEEHLCLECSTSWELMVPNSRPGMSWQCNRLDAR